MTLSIDGRPLDVSRRATYRSANSRVRPDARASKTKRLNDPWASRMEGQVVLCHIGVGNGCHVGAVWIDLNPLLNIVREPIIAKNGNAASLPDDVLSLPGNLPKGANIAGFISRVNVRLPRDQQLDRVVPQDRFEAGEP